MLLYDLHHAAATLALAAGVSAKVVSEQLGHAGSAFTLDAYSHLLPHMQTEAECRIERLLALSDQEWTIGPKDRIPHGSNEEPVIIISASVIKGDLALSSSRNSK
jgi:hypothetical protein